MPTLVQQPAIADTQVSQLQALPQDTVVPKQGLSDWLLGVIPVVQGALNKHKDDNKDYNLALGMNDELNTVTREVSALDREYYKHGHTLQAIQTATTLQDAEVKARLEARIAANPDIMDNPDELLAEYEEVNRTRIESIHESGLPLDIQNKSYAAQLQSHAQQIKEVKSVIETAAVNQEIKSRSAIAEGYMRVALNADSTAEDLELAMGVMTSQSEAAISKRTDLTPDQRSSMHNAQIATIINNAVTLVANNTDLGEVTNLKLVGNLKSAVIKQLNNFDQDPTVFDKLIATQDKLNTLDSKLSTQRDANAQYNHNQSLVDFEAGIQPMDESTFRTKLADIQARVGSGDITPQQGNRETDDITRLYNKNLQAVAAAAKEPITGVEIVTQNMPKSQFMDMFGSTSDEYDNRVMSTFYRSNADDASGRVQAGLQAIEWTDRGGGGEYNPELRRKASALVMNNLVQFLSDPNSASKDGFGRAEQNWNLLVAKAQAYEKSSESYKVEDLLGSDSSMSDAQRVQIRSTLLQGGSIKQAMQSFQTAEDTKANVSTFREGVMTWNAKTMGMSNWFGASSNLVGWKGSTTGALLAIDDHPNAASRDIIKDTQATNIRNVGLNSDTEMAAKFPRQLKGDSAVAELARVGQIIPSRKRYNATTVNASTAKVLHNIPSIPEGVRGQYVATAMDAIVANYAGKANVDTNNVFITTHDRNNKYVYISHLDKDGRMSDPSMKSVSEVISIADKSYKAQVKAAAMSSTKVTANVVGKSSIGDAWGRGNTQSKETYSYNTKANIGTMSLTAVDSRNRGKKFNVNVPAVAVGMYNGNPDLTMAAMKRISSYEGFHLDVEKVGDTKSGKLSENGAFQMSLTKDGKPNIAKKWDTKIRAASGNAQALVQVQAEFMAENYAVLQEDARAVGIPVATQSAYPEVNKPTQMYIFDLVYHGGLGTRGKVRETLTQKDQIAGLQKLMALPAYKSSGAKQEAGKPAPPRSVRQKQLVLELYKHYQFLGRIK